MRIRVITEVEVGEPGKVLEAARRCHFYNTGEWAIPSSLGAAVGELLSEPGIAPLDCGFEIVEQRAEAATPEEHQLAERAVAAWQAEQDFEAEERRFQGLVDKLET